MINTLAGISDPICNENYSTISLGRDWMPQVYSNFRANLGAEIPAKVIIIGSRRDKMQVKVCKSAELFHPCSAA